MNKKLILSCIIGVLLSIESSYAAFEYSGTFASNRSANDVQSYYILLSENTNVTFSIKSDGKESKEVFVNSIKLTSDENINLKSNSGISSYKVTTTGIYEVSVSSNAALSKEIAYNLVVNETATKDEVVTKNETATKEEFPQKVEESQKTEPSKAESPKTDNQVPTTQSFASIGSAKIVDSSEEIVSSKTNTSDKKEEKFETEIVNNQNIVQEITPKTNTVQETSSNTTAIKYTEPVTKKEDIDVKTIVAAPLNKDENESTGFDFSQLDPDAPAVEDGEEEVVVPKTVIKPKTLTYSGKINLIDSIDAYRFLGDKNKCWPTKICFDADNNYWLLDGQLCHITSYSPKGTELNSFGNKGKAVNELGIPVSLAIFKNYILVGDRQKNCIHVFDKKGNWINLIQSDPKVGLQISNPASICVRNNEIWVGDSSTKRILCFDGSLSFLGSFGSSKESKIDSISAISTDNEFIYILEEEGILKKFGTMGNFLSAVPTDVKYSNDLFVDSNKNFWITDSEQGKVICYDNEGKVKYSIDRKSLSGVYNGSDKFSPSSIAVNATANIAITDTYSKQIKVFEIK